VKLKLYLLCQAAFSVLSLMGTLDCTALPLNALAEKETDPSQFEAGHLAPESGYVFNWVRQSGNNAGLPFAILDKHIAQLFVFDGNGSLRGSTPVLLGLAIGDKSVPGIGSRKLSSIRPEERTTPSGRFVVALDHNLHGKEILWIDYEAAISMHPVINTNPKERRLERLASVTPLDNRISYGCINVPPEFFKNVIHQVFKDTNGIVYVLPETVAVTGYFDSIKSTPLYVRK
jgi:hypothetical protein